MVHGSRFEEQLSLRGRQLCRTREDLGDDSPCDIYRLRYPNLHPNLQTRKYHLKDRHDMDPDLDPDIVVVQHPPSLSHAGLLLMDALGQPLWHKMQPKGYITCRDKIWRTNIRPRPLAFFMEPPTYEVHQEFEEPDFTIDDRYPVCRNPQLIIYQDELNLILDELEPFLRQHFSSVRSKPTLISVLDFDFAYITHHQYLRRMFSTSQRPRHISMDIYT